MIINVNAYMKAIKKAETDDEVVCVLNSLLCDCRVVTEDWTKWGLDHFIYLCEENRKKKPVCRNYALQFLNFMIDGYLKLSKSERLPEMLEVLWKCAITFKTSYNVPLLRFFTDDALIDDWFITDAETACKTNIDIAPAIECESDEPSEKFKLMEVLLQVGRPNKNISIYKMYMEMYDNLCWFPALRKKREHIKEIIEDSLSDHERIYLFEHGKKEFFYHCPFWYINKKFFQMTDEERIYDGWEYMLKQSPKEINYCIKYIMPVVVASKSKKIGKNNLANIFHYKNCQRMLIKSDDFKYALPEILEFAANREFHDTLCVELKEMLGYSTDISNEEEVVEVV